jgi:PIN domain nuclease of toxin-antitoxin system
MGLGQAREESNQKVNGYLLDTHVWLWVMRGEHEQVSSNFFAELEDWQRQRTAYLSPYSCWEIGVLVATNQYRLDRPLEEIWTEDTDSESFVIAELTGPILYDSTSLPGDIHKDPADRILAATARAYDLTLVTRDKSLLNYAKQGHLKARKP